MRKLLENRKIQKLFLPLAFVFILIVWCAAKWGNPFNPICDISAALGIVFFILDRQLKPREHERAERRQKRRESADQNVSSD